MTLNIGDPHADVAGAAASSDANELTKNRRIEELVAELDSVKHAQFLYNTVLSNAPLIIATFDTEGIFTLSEGKGLAAIGSQPGNAVGHSIFEIYSDSPEIANAVKGVLRGEPQSYQSFIVNRYV